MLYTYANPVYVILSLLRLFNEKGEKWIKEHYLHLKAPYNNFKKIIEEDNLRLEKHLKSWLQEDKIPIAFVKYENMWSHQKDISNFLGFKITLPAYKNRKTIIDVNKDITKKIEKTYGNLNKKINNLDSFFVINNKNEK